MAQPLLAEEADIDVDAVQRPESANGIRAILQDMRGPYGGGRLEELRQWALCDEIVELFVDEVVRPQTLLPPTLCRLQSRREIVDRVHRARIVDVVTGDE